ncbi:MAG: ECF transporter S component [Candidatus Saccharibacteria bacterium]
MNPTLRYVTRTAVLLAIALVFQYVKLPPPFGQILTGSVVNALLIIAVAYVGITSGITIGLLTPIFAFALGVMGFPFLIPVIIAANLLLVIVFYYARRFNNYAAIVIAAIAKFLIFYGSVNFILASKIANLPAKAAQAIALGFGPLQLLTAIIGGLIAAFIISKYNINNEN